MHICTLTDTHIHDTKKWRWREIVVIFIVKEVSNGILTVLCSSSDSIRIAIPVLDSLGMRFVPNLISDFIWIGLIFLRIGVAKKIKKGYGRATSNVFGPDYFCALQGVVMRCSVLQIFAECCSVLQCVVVCSSMIVLCCRSFQCVIVSCSVMQGVTACVLLRVSMCCILLRSC